MSTNVEPLDEEARLQILQRIEQRKKELLEKRRQYEVLTGKTMETDQFQHSVFELKPKTTDTPSSTTLVNDIVLAATTAAQEAAQSALVSEAPSAEDTAKKAGAMKEGDVSFPITDGGLAVYSRAIKRLVGPLAATPATVDIVIGPKTVDRFNKSCQCDTELLPRPSLDRVDARLPTPQQPAPLLVEGPLPLHVTADAMMKTRLPTVAFSKEKDLGFVKGGPSEDVGVVPEKGMEVEELLEEDREKLLKSSVLEDFMNRASRTVERALGESDLFMDYATLGDTALTGDRDLAGESVRQLQTYEDNRWSRHRSVLDLRAHSTFQDIFLAAYGQRVDASSNDPDGCALIWNVTMTQRPESYFVCQSRVCTAMFDPYRPHCVIGGTFTGAIVVWDARAKTRPVQRTPLSSKSHHHPVYSMELVGTQHAHNLITVDNDGRLCLWSMAMLIQPTETIELKKPSKDTSYLCIGFADGENNSFLGGTDNGSIFAAQIHGSKAGTVATYQGHTAPVTALHWHPSSLNDEQGDYSDLVLSSSFDWTVKLWNPKSRATPLHSFEAALDNCLDIEWHPRHPGVFAACQTDGTFHIWDIGKDIEVPQVVQHLTGQEALEQLKWTNDGTRLMTGDTSGAVTMWSVPNSMSRPRAEDYTQFSAKIEELKAVESAALRSGVGAPDL